jgi:hypothetical protein
MTRQDISFLENTELQVEMPLRITGTCTGVATLMQKVTTLMLADAHDTTRNYGGSLGRLLMGTNNRDEAVLRNYFQASAVAVYQLLQEEQALQLHELPDDEVITDLKVTAVTIISPDTVSATYVITNKASDEGTFNINIPINRGE